MKGNGVQGGQVADTVGKALLLPRDMKVWNEDFSERVLENLKCDSVLVTVSDFFLFPFLCHI